MARTLIVGDIHGCYDQFIELLDKVQYTTKDRLLLLGDLVDRGPKILEVLDYCIKHPEIEVLMGNHDRMLLDALRIYNIGSVKKIKSDSSLGLVLSKGEDFAKQVEQYLESLSYYKKLKDGIVAVHAGMKAGASIAHQDKLDMIIARPTEKGFNKLNGYTFLVGHTPTIAIETGHDTLIETGNTIFLDCGCSQGGNLCCYWLEEKMAYYVRGKDYTV